MALSPGQKVRKSPRLGTGSSKMIPSSNSLSRKQLFNEHPSTPLSKKKLSLPRNENPDSAGVEEKREYVPVPAGEKSHKRTNMVKMEVNLKEGNLDCNIDKDGKKILDTSVLNVKATNTKSKSKRKSKVKVETELPNTGLGEEGKLASHIVNDKEEKSNTTAVDCRRRVSIK